MRQSTLLKVAAIAIAAPRYAGAFAVSIGADPFTAIPWLLTVEVASGAAMALLEGLAVAYVFAQWRLLVSSSLQWKVLGGLLLMMLLTVPLVSLPYLLAAQTGTHQITEFMPFWARVAWSLVVLAVPPLVIGAVGYADQDAAAVEQHRANQQIAIEQSRANRLLAVEQSRQQVRAGKEQSTELNQLPASAVVSYVCPTCSKPFSTQRALNGHKAHCRPAKTVNGKAKGLVTL